MAELELYSTIRNEIVVNHVLMHLMTIFVVFMLVGGTWLVETRRSFVSLLLPLLSLAWAAAMVRFDFFIHRQGAYLRLLEASLQKRVAADLPFWELSKAQLRSTRYVVPTADALGILIVVVPTIICYLGHANLSSKNGSGAAIYLRVDRAAADRIIAVKFTFHSQNRRSLTFLLFYPSK
jgi:hypothetical protein